MTQSTQISSLRGHIEGFKNGQLYGWVYDAERPDESLFINIYAGEQLIWAGLADGHREDLKLAGLGNGCHEFLVDLDISLLSVNHAYPITMSLQDDSAVPVNTFDLILTDELVTEIKQNLQSNTDGSSFKSIVKGYIEDFKDGNLYGWVYDSAHPNESLDVSIYIDKKLVGIGLAGIYRPDLEEAGFGNGYHGFIINLDLTLLDLNKLYPVHIFLNDKRMVLINNFDIDFTKKLIDTNTILVTNDIKSSILKGYIETFREGILTGWVYDSKNPNNSLSIKIYAGEKLVGFGIANIYREDLYKARFGNGYHCFNIKVNLNSLPMHASAPITIRLDDDSYIDTNVFKINITKERLCHVFSSDYVVSCLGYAKNNALDEYISALETQPYISCHPLFDPEFYKEQADALGLDINIPLIIHYLIEGWKLSIDPHPLFDSHYYMNVLGLSSFDCSPLEHYLINGVKAFASPSPFFDGQFFNHNMNVEYKATGYIYDLLIANKWIDFHSHITQESVIQIQEDDCLLGLIEKYKNVSPHDFVKIIYDLRKLCFVRKSDYEKDNIDLSVIVLNYNKPVHTILCVYAAHLALCNISHEIIVVDNGSDFFYFNVISKYLNGIPNCKIIHFERNRFFGEGNNIALDKSKGQYICFLNNDAYVNRGLFKSLLNAFDKDKKIGAVGPMFINPGYILQEFGGKVSGCGQIIQVGKGIKIDDDSLAKINTLPRFADYCSAACCIIHRKVLEQVGGFDYIFEPFYYEDTDLCSRIRSAGYKLYMEPEAYVMHFENTSTREYLKDDFWSLIQKNKLKFSKRWFGKLDQIEQGGLLLNNIPRVHSSLIQDQKRNYFAKKRAFVYSPYLLNAGGGEKYILTVAISLSEKFQTTIVFPEIFSTTRLRMVAEDLGLSADNLLLSTWNDALKQEKPDIFIAMGNEIIPSVPGIGRRNLYHCQFPFPLANVSRPDTLETLSGYEAFIVNSDFTKSNICRELQLYRLPLIPIHVVYPPCWDGFVDAQLSKVSKKGHKHNYISILNVGRFFQHGHNKRQDVILEIIRKLNDYIMAKNYKISATLLGSVSKSDESYYTNLALQAKKLGVSIASNVERSEIDFSYQNSNIYIHAAGFGHCDGYFPYQLEHFGIAVVEAMINGLIPVVYSAGGPLEIVTKVGVGEVFSDVDDAITKVWKIAGMSSSEIKQAQEKMIYRCQDFSILAFKKKIHEIIDS
jgi:GT2 family glycosyltransferase/glycosyltransferase involved in cell wall biosynthesis